MFCSNCGASAQGDSIFCQNCGAKLEKEETEMIQENGDTVSNEDCKNTETSDIACRDVKEKHIKKPLNKKVFAVVAAVLVVMISVITVVSVLSKRVSVEKFIKTDNISVTGYNGYGKLSVSADEVIDYDAVEDALGKKSSSSESSQSLLDSFDDYFSSTTINTYIKAEYVKDYSNLSNGDIIEIEITADFDGINRLGYEKKLVGDENFTVQYTVSGLKESTSIDPFSLIKKIYVDPTTDYVSLHISYNDSNDFTEAGYITKTDQSNEIMIYLPSDEEDADDEYQFTISFDTDAILDNIHSNDKFTLKANTTEDLASYGIILSTTEKEFTADTLDYLTDKSKITSEIITKMKNNIENISESVTAAQYFLFSLNDDSEQFEFSAVVFLVKGSERYYRYDYPSSAIKISDSGDVVINYDSSVRSYSSYSKISDFEDEYTSEYDKLSRITL